MENVVIARGLAIGRSTPKIIVSVTQTQEQDILQQARLLCKRQVDIVEWRADYYPAVENKEQLMALLQELRQALGETPLLFTYRTRAEGGRGEATGGAYQKILCHAADSGHTDLVDLELLRFGAMGVDTLKYIRQTGAACIGSQHDFAKTPPKEAMLSALEQMLDLGADVAKLAVMPQTPEDVLRLLCITQQASGWGKGPVITMAMGRLGMVSRIGGGIFGSAATFGAMGQASAPGQPDVEQLQKCLALLYQD